MRIQQSRLADRHADSRPTLAKTTLLRSDGASIPDVVSIRQWLTDADGIKAYTLVRSEFVKHECASMLAVIPALVRPSIEVDVVAVRASPAS